jgi:membrane associated rhomboid family serine protease
MNTGSKRSALSYIPGYKNNAVLQLIIASGVAFVMLGCSWGVMQIVYQGDSSNFNQYFLANIGLPAVAAFKAHWWTVLTYGWFSFNGFFDLLSNMLWLYCFGSVVQMLVGPRQIIPLFAYSLVAGGIVYLLAQLLPGELGKTPVVAGLLGPRAGLLGMAAAAVALTPNYRFYLTETFRIHILVVAGIFAALMIMNSGLYLPVILLLAGGGLTGFAYVKLLKAGYRPGEWMYSLSAKVESLATPHPDAEKNRKMKTRGAMYEPKSGITQKRIDDILDKINQKGYNALSAEEKDILMRAAKE